MTAAHYGLSSLFRRRRPQPAPARRADRGNQATGTAGRQVGQLRLGGPRRRRPRSRAAADAPSGGRARTRPVCVIAHTVKGKGVSFMEDRVEWHHKVPSAEQVAIATPRSCPHDPSATQAAMLHDCRKAFAETLIALARRRRADRRRMQRLGGFQQPDRVQGRVPGPDDQCRDRRAGPCGRRRRARQRRHDPLRQRCRAVPHRPRARADQGGRGLQPSPLSSCAGRARAWPTASSAPRTIPSRTCPGCVPWPTSRSSSQPTRSRPRRPSAGPRPIPARATCASPGIPVPDVIPPGSPFQPGRALQVDRRERRHGYRDRNHGARAPCKQPIAAPRGHRTSCPQHVAFVEPLDTRCRPEGSRPDQGPSITAEEATTTGGLGAAVATLTAQHQPVAPAHPGSARAFAPTGSTAFPPRATSA